MRIRKLPCSIQWGMALLLISLPWISKDAVAAYITNIEFRGGGCVMQDGSESESCTNASATFDTDYGKDGALNVTVTKNFSKSALVDGEGTSRKPPDAGGDEEESHEEEEIFERLAPIQMFITLKNSGNAYGDSDNTYGDLYLFSEEIMNDTGISWDGFYYALKQNEDDRALFSSEETPESTIFEDYDLKGKKLTFSGGSFSSASGIWETFSFGIVFFDLAPESDELKEDGTFTVMLQEFPLIAKEDTTVEPAPSTLPLTPVPEPSTILLFLIGLASLAGTNRKSLTKFIQ